MSKIMLGILFLFFSFTHGMEPLDSKKAPSVVNQNEELHKKNNETVTSEGKADQSLVCKSGKEERVLSLAKKGSGCEVIYTKQGAAKVIAQQKLGTLRCEDVFHTLQDKLAKGGFSCEAK